MSPTKSTTSTTEETGPTRSAYRLTQGTHTVWEGSKTSGQRVTYDARGDNNIVQLTDEEAAHPAFRGRIERVQGQPGQYEAAVATRATTDSSPENPEDTEVKTGPPEGVGTAMDDPNANNWTNKLSGMTWQEASKEVEAIDDPAELDAIRTAEEQGKNRKSVLEAIDARSEELAG